MSRYSLGVHHAKQKKIRYKLRNYLIAIIVLIILAALGIFIDSILESRIAQTPSVSSKPQQSLIQPSIEVFTSPYFKFQTDRNWQFISNESTATKFVYRRGTSNQVSADMTVYINSIPSLAELQATRVLPVTYNNDSHLLNPSFVSEHCRDVLPETDVKRDQAGELTLTVQSVKFLCDVDGTSYSVVVGLENNTQIMNLPRQDGTNADYIIYFRDLRFSANPQEFVDIVDTFEVR
jgi:hypothetical protein